MSRSAAPVEFDDFLESFDSSWGAIERARVGALYGFDHGELKKALDLIAGRLGAISPDTRIARFGQINSRRSGSSQGIEARSAEELINELNSLDLFAASKTLIVGPITRLEKETEERLIGYIENPNDRAIALFSFILDARDRNAEAAFLDGNLPRAIKARSRALISLAPRRGGLKEWIERYLKRESISIDRSALDELARLFRARPPWLSAELDKLALYVGSSGAPITSEAVEAMISHTRESALWELNDAIIRRSRDKALGALVDFARRGFNEQILMKLTQNELGRLFLVRSAKEARIEPGAIGRKGAMSARQVSARLGAIEGWPIDHIRRAALKSARTHRSIVAGGARASAALFSFIGRITS